MLCRIVPVIGGPHIVGVFPRPATTHLAAANITKACKCVRACVCMCVRVYMIARYALVSACVC